MASNGPREKDDNVMGEVITLINKLHDVASSSKIDQTYFDLPQMAVVGEQSAGKSSVLETIVGKDFLPRGTGIVTRCPLVLQLVHHSTEYAEFLHKPNYKFTDYDAVRKEIEAETDRKAGSNKSITNVAISLKVYSPDVPNLTLVDLPGLAKNPVGDQPDNIGQIIRDMLLNYIKQENTIILAVTTATQDIANSDALHLAQMVDPEGLRTIGIITKLDIMGAGTDARSILENKVIPLKRGYVGIVNRNQEDIDKKRDIISAREKEMNFFTSHIAYKDMVDRMGSKYLTEMLSKQLIAHIREKMPSMQTQIKQENARLRQILEAMNAFEHERDKFWHQTKLVELIQKFGVHFKTNVSGRSLKVDNESVSGGGKLNDCFYTQIYPLLDRIRFAVATKKDLYILWRNEVGFQNILFFDQEVFNNIVRKFLRQYKEPLEMSTLIASAIIKEAVTISVRKLDGYPKLQNKIVKLMMEEIVKNEEFTVEQLKFHIKAQKIFINIYHPDFMKQPNLTSLDDEHAVDEVGTLNRSSSLTSFMNPDEASFTEDDIVTDGNEIMRGYVNVHAKLAIAKPYYFVLSLNKVVWYKDEEDTRIRGHFSIDELTITVLKTKTKSKKYLLRGNSKKKDSQKLLISFRKDLDEKEWLESFQRLGISVKKEKDEMLDKAETHQKNGPFVRTGSKTRQQEVATTSDTKSGLNVPVIKDNDPRQNFENNPVLDEVMQKLISYMAIIDETMHDLSLKYISYFLVHKTLKYTNFKLLTDVQKEDIIPLMEVSPEEIAKREEYFKLYYATQEALKIMTDVSSGRN